MNENNTKSDPSIHDLATAAALQIIEEASIVGQIELRFRILESWFRDIGTARRQLSGQVVLECGCGQGDMTVALATLVQVADTNSGRVLAVDPAPLDYGAPVTLGQAQAHISKTVLGRTIDWIQQDPVDYIKTGMMDKSQPQFIILALSTFYLPSEEYLSSLVRHLLQHAVERQDGVQPLLLLSEWGMRASDPAAEAHLFAVKVQALRPIRDGNVRTVIHPERMIRLVEEAGWHLQNQGWINSPDVDDGRWEVAAARSIKPENMVAGMREYLTQMEEAYSRHGKVKSMDVWTGSFSPKSNPIDR